jgi:hypothetical protein
LHLNRGRGGAGHGSHGPLPFDAFAFVNAAQIPPSTLRQYLPLPDRAHGVRSDDISLIANQILSDPDRFSRHVMLCADGMSIVRGVCFRGVEIIGPIEGPLPLARLPFLTTDDLANEVLVWMVTDLTGQLHRPIAAFPINNVTTKSMWEMYDLVVAELQSAGLTVITMATDGLTLSFLLDMEEKSDVIPISDYPHNEKTLLTTARAGRCMTKNSVSCSLQIIVDEMKKGGFSHLTEKQHLFPRDGQEVGAVLDLISPVTQAELNALPSVEARLLAQIFEHMWMLWEAFDVKRSNAEAPNLRGRPVLSHQARLDKLKSANAFLQQV